jgi:hypothetical protein
VSYDAVVVPSYARPVGCSADTVTTLLRAGVPAGRIQVWVGGGDDPAMLSAYRQHLPDPAVTLLPAPVGLANARNAISAAWPANARLVNCDDDIRAIQRLSPDASRLVDVPNLSVFFAAAFDWSDRQGVGLWGLSPVRNPFFMKGDWVAGLYFAIGQCFGVVNDPKLQLAHGAKEDYERTLLYYERYGAVGRINDHVAHTRPMRGHKGGMQTVAGCDGLPRRDAEHAAITDLKRRWPYLIRDKPARDGFPEIALTQPKGVR